MKTKKFINFSTVWDDYNGIKENQFNLYSAYKKAFSKILNFYRNKFKKVKFYELMLSDTFGKNDNRLKIINVLRKNYKSNTITKIISKNLYVKLLRNLGLSGVNKTEFLKKFFINHAAGKNKI